MIIDQNHLQEPIHIEQIYDKYDLIVNKLRRKGVPYYDAPDFAVEIMLTAVKAAHQLRDEKKLEAWLGRIIDNSIKRYYADIYRKRDMETVIVETIADNTTVEATIEGKELRQNLVEVFACLNERERVIFVMRHIDELKFREIAKVLGLNENTAKSIYNRSCKKLRKFIKHGDLSCFFAFFDRNY